MPTLVLREAEVATTTSLSPDTIRRLVAAGKFPRPIRLSQRAVGWLCSDVEAWIADRAEQRDSEEALA